MMLTHVTINHYSFFYFFLFYFIYLFLINFQK